MQVLKQKRQNEPLSSLTHAIGILLAITALVLLIVFASLRGNAWHIVSFSIFGTSMILLYTASTIYHFVCATKQSKKTLQKFDHAMIYVLIAGTYTPITLIPLRGGWGWSLFGVIWGLALLGVMIKTFNLPINKWQSTLLYILMGWLVVIAIVPLIKALSGMGLFWLFLGGVCYTLGVLFFALDTVVKRSRWWGMHEIFHLFVIAGSFCHFWLMIKYILYIS